VCQNEQTFSLDVLIDNICLKKKKRKKKKKKKLVEKHFFSIISSYSFPAWCFLQLLTSGNAASSHSHV